jgi:hypothetical protein
MEYPITIKTKVVRRMEWIKGGSFMRGTVNGAGG